MRKHKNRFINTLAIGVLWALVWSVAVFSSAAATSMTTDPSDFYWNTSLGNEGEGVIEYNGEIYWSSRANLAPTATYRYDNTGWWVQISNDKNQSTYFYVSEESCLIGEEEIDGYGYYLYKISRSALVEGVSKVGYTTADFFSGTVTVELDGNVQVVNMSGFSVAGPYSLQSDSELDTLLAKMTSYGFSNNSKDVVQYQLRNKILNIKGSDILLQYTISYDANGGTGAPESQVKYYGVNLAISSTEPTRSGYTFIGWNTNAKGTGTNYQPGETLTSNEAQTLYAVWEKNIAYYELDLGILVDGVEKDLKGYATVDLYINGTKVGDDITSYTEKIAEESTYKVQDIKVATGYGNSGEDVYSGTIQNHTSVTLKIDTLTYVISYNQNTEETVINLPDTQKKSYGKDLALSESIPVREGYTFVGWNTTSDGKGVYYDPGDALKENQKTTLYAIWDENPTLEVSDVYMYLKDELDEERFYRDVIAWDDEDGDITEKVEFLNLDDVLTELEDLKMLIVSCDQVYEIEIKYSVTDSAGAMIEKQAILYAYVVIEDYTESMSSGYVRFISDEYIDTLEEESVWREEEMMLYLKEVLQTR